MTGESAAPAEMPGDVAVAHLEKAANLLMMHDYVTTARQMLDLRKLVATTSLQRMVSRIAEVADQVAGQAGVGASETAGLIISVLAANPEHIDRFMAEGSELFIDGTIRPENGCLTHMAMNGQVVSPTRLRMMKGQSQ